MRVILNSTDKESRRVQIFADACQVSVGLGTEMFVLKISLPVLGRKDDVEIDLA
jgi:hypothetical protein